MLPPASNDDMLFGRFRIVRELDEGGSGVVFHVHDTRLRVDRALKLPRVEVLASESRRKRFREEAAKAASVEHVNVVRVYEADDLGVPYLVMEYCPDGSLKDRIERGTPFDPIQAAKIMIGVARGTARIHAAELLHRDLKPGNILIVRSPDGVDVPKIADFGLARYLNADARTRAGVSGVTLENAGTIPYMSPEQLLGETLTERSDIHALGAILYELLAGRRAFPGPATPELIGRIVKDDPLPLRNVPKALRTVVLKCLRKRPEDRYATADELADDLERFLKEEEIEARPEPVVVRTRRWAVRRRSFLALAVPVFGLSGLSYRLADDLSREQFRRRKRADRERVWREVEYVAQALRDSKPFHAWERLADLDAATDGAASRDFAVRVMKRRVLDRIEPIGRHESPVAYAIHSPDRSLILTAEKGGDVVVTDANSLRTVAKLLGAGGVPGEARAFSADGKRFALAYEKPKAGGAEIVAWDLGSLAPTTNSRVRRLPPVWTSPAAGPNRVSDLAFMNRDRSFAVVRATPGGARWTCELYRTPLGSEAPGRFEGSGTLRPSPDGTCFAVGTADAVILMDASDLKKLRSLSISAPRHAEFSDDGRLLAAAGGGKGLIWSVDDGVLRDRFDIDKSSIDFRFAPDGLTLVALHQAGSLRFRDRLFGKDWSHWRPDESARPYRYFRFSPEGERVLTFETPDGGEPERTSLRSTRSGEEVANFRLLENINVVERCFTADGRRVLGSVDRIVARVRTEPGESYATMRHGPDAWACLFSPDASTMITGGEDGDVRLWDAETGKSHRGKPIKVHPGTVSSLAFSPDGRTLLSASLTKKSNVALWSLHGGEPRVLDGIFDKVRCAEFSPDGRRIVTASDDWVVRVWNPNQGRIVHEITDFGDRTRSVAFSPDGRRMAVACEDGTVREYRTGSWEPIGDPLVARHESGAVAYRPDGSELAMAVVNSLDDRTGRVLIRSLDDPEREKREFVTDAGWIWRLVYSPDGDSIAVGGESGVVQILCAETGRELLRFDGASEVRGLAFAPDGSALGICRLNGEVMIVRADPGGGASA